MSDLHLSHTPPKARAGEDWYAVQRGYLEQLDAMLPTWDTPLLAAGDLFHTYNQPPEFIDFLLDHLPTLIAVPGQHDLPGHRYEDVHKSVFGVMVKVRRVTLVPPGEPLHLAYNWKGINGMRVFGFPWGVKPSPPEGPRPNGYLDVALCHKYVWLDKSNKHPHATAAQNVAGLRKALKGYTAAFFGDNHRGFKAQVGRCTVVNCGAFIRRRVDEASYSPRVTVLFASGRVKRVKLDTSQDKIDTTAEDDLPEKTVQVKGLLKTKDERVDFEEAVRLVAARKSTPEAVRDFLLRSIGGGRREKKGGR